ADRIVQLATYEVTDPTIDSQMRQLKNSGANVFFNIATPKFASQAIKKAAELGWRPTHYLSNVSASANTVMRPAGVDASQGIITAQYVKDVTDPLWASAPDVAAWHRFMGRYMPRADKSDVTHVFGYAVSATLLEVLKRAGDNLTRENVM